MASKKPNPETIIQRQIIDYLLGQGHFAVKIPVQPIKAGKFYKKNPITGWPDVLCLLMGGRGQLVVIEVKTDTGVLSPEQRKWLRELEAYGVICIVARSVEDVRKRLEGYPWS